MTSARISGAIMVTLDGGKQFWVDAVEVEPAPTQEGSLLWFRIGSEWSVVYLDKDGEGVDTPLLEYCVTKKRGKKP